MKKLTVLLFSILMLPMLYAKNVKKEDIPAWLEHCMEGDSKKIAESLDIDKDAYKVFIFHNSKKSTDEPYDMKKKTFIDACLDTEYLISGIVEKDINVFETSASLDHNYLSISIKDKTDGKSYILLESSGASNVIHHYENYDKAIEILKRNKLFKYLKLEADYYLYTDIENAKKTDKKVHKQKPILVDHGTSPVSKKKYTVANYYAVYIFPVAVYEQAVNELLHYYSE